jgi:hypothetical protein
MRIGDRWKASAAVLCAACLGGCAASPEVAPAMPAPAATGAAAKEEAREPATIEEAQAQLDRARATLAGQPASGPTTPTGGVGVESSTGAGGATQSAEAPPASRCGNACGAVSSMRRAVDAICRLAGETDARCTDARRTLRDSEAKVVACSCPAP